MDRETALKQLQEFLDMIGMRSEPDNWTLAEVEALEKARRAMLVLDPQKC